MLRQRHGIRCLCLWGREIARHQNNRQERVGFCPEANHSGFAKRQILNLEQRPVVEDDFEACASKLHAKRMPLIGGDSQ
jgi:hypothetical protein